MKPPLHPSPRAVRIGPSLLARLLLLAACALWACALWACDGPTPPARDAGADAGVVDAFRLPPRVHEELPDPEALRAGVAEARIPAPVGIGTMGFGAFGVDPSPSPFAQNFPGTTRSHGELSFRAVALSRGEAFELIFVRMDTVGVFQQLREAVLDELRARTGRDLDDALILAGNHTHSGPGRILMSTGALVALGDTFFPEFYDRIVETLADVVERALEDRAPAELGIAVASSSEGHSDRRCENDSLAQVQEVPDMPLIAVRREGRIDAIVASYAYHGTVLGIDELTLSGDMGAVVEQRIAERFDHPVSVLFFNSWGGDMAPANPTPSPEELGPELPGGYDRMDRLGELLADTVMPAVEAMSFSAEHSVRARTYRVALSREALGYEEGAFPYPHGGAFCGIGGDGNCEDSTPIEGLDQRCIPISRSENLPKQTMITAGQVGELYFVTGAGEWTTALAARVLDRVREVSGGDAMFIGYANDYTGYSTPEEDWWQGGYEASGALWGPRQGDYLADRGTEAFETYFDRWTEPPWLQPVRVEPFSGYEGYPLYEPEGPEAFATVSSEPPATVAADAIVSFTVQGADPWLGAPVATLETAAGEPVMRRNGTPLDSRGYDLWVDLAVTPSYAEAARAETRSFAWTFHFPVSRRAGGAYGALAGAYRFRVELPSVGGETTITTAEFTVE